MPKSINIDNFVMKCQEHTRRRQRLDYQKKVDKSLEKDINSLTMISVRLFWCCKKGVYPCQYMNNWGKFSETSLPEK